MIHDHQTARLLVAAAFLAPPPAFADDDGRLIMYDFMTEIGIVARREFLNENGRLTREIYYTLDWDKYLPAPASGPATTLTSLPVSLNGPFDPDKLRACSLNRYDYDSQGRKVRFSSFSPDGVLQSFSTTEYRDGATSRVHRSFTPDGRRVLETHRNASGRQFVTIRFDRSGHRVVQLSGPMPDHERWVEEWGPLTGGLMCRIDPNFARTDLANASITMTVRCFTNGPASIHHGFSVEDVRPELCDLRGDVVPIDDTALQRRKSDLHRSNPGFQPRRISIGRGEAVWAGSFELRDWYPELHPGHYRLSIQRRSTGESFDLKSNSILIEIAPTVSPPVP